MALALALPDCCGPPALLTGNTGPDRPGIACYTPDGCGCGPGPCQISLDDFICAVRQLLPEGEPYRPSKPPGAAPVQNYGAAVVCDNLVGSASCPGEQLILGGCCDEEGPIACVEEEIAPQLAVVDTFAAILYGMVQALCKALCELDPCCASDTLERWAERFGIVRTDALGCVVPFPPAALAFLVCLFSQLKSVVYNLKTLEMLAGLFGAQVRLELAGAINCPTYLHYWHMARDRDESCRDGAPTVCGPDIPRPQRVLRFAPCETRPPESINVIVCPAERVFPQNCNRPVPSPQPYDPDIYDAFLWLLPRILPKPDRWCIYECDAMQCFGTPLRILNDGTVRITNDGAPRLASVLTG